jgi:tRNA-specific 2-thiouridylase
MKITIHDSRKPEKLIAAMSGGVDSSAAAAVYAAVGVAVIGVTLRLTRIEDLVSGDAKAAGASLESCGSDLDRKAAAAAAERIGIPHRVIDYRPNFDRRILRPAWEAYQNGMTPNPCVRCNRFIKFERLLAYAEEIGAAGVITGHYARISADDNGHPVLRQGKDSDKDQSYFLYNLSPGQLSRSFFPLGHYSKNEVRSFAEEIGLENAGKKESQDACFSITGESFPDSLSRYFGESSKQGRFISAEGSTLGRHQGIHRYTIGQRRGLGIALGRPAYVSRIDPESGTITVSVNEAELRASSAAIDTVNWLLPSVPEQPFPAAVKVRSVHPAAEAEIVPLGDARAEVHFAEALRAVTPGQAAVFYRGDRVLGGGRIVRVPAS